MNVGERAGPAVATRAYLDPCSTRLGMSPERASNAWRLQWAARAVGGILFELRPHLLSELTDAQPTQEKTRT